MAAPRKTRRTPSTTSSKSSQTPTESPQSESQESTKKSDETSTPETEGTDTSSSTLSEEDANDALFADADAQASGGAESDEDDPDEDQDDDDENVDPETAQDAPESTERDGDSVVVTSDTGTLVNEYGVRAVGDVHEFHVKDERGDYTFRGHVQHNIIIVAEPAWREVPLRNTTATTRLLAHHKGQTLPLTAFEEFAPTLKDEED